MMKMKPGLFSIFFKSYTPKLVAKYFEAIKLNEMILKPEAPHKSSKIGIATASFE